MLRPWLEIVTHRDATKAVRMGRYGALGLAAWLGAPAVIAGASGRVQQGIISPVEIAIVAVLVGLAFYGATRFGNGRGARIGAILLIVLVVEVAKRLTITFDGTLVFGVFDAVVTFMMFFGLLNGVRGARALPRLTADEDLKDVFE